MNEFTKREPRSAISDTVPSAATHQVAVASPPTVPPGIAMPDMDDWDGEDDWGDSADDPQCAEDDWPDVDELDEDAEAVTVSGNRPVAPHADDDDFDDDEVEAAIEGETVEELRERERGLPMPDQVRCYQNPDAAGGGHVYPDHDEQGDGEYEWESTGRPERPVKFHQVKIPSLFPLVDVDRFAQFRLAGSRATADMVRDVFPDEGVPFRLQAFGTQALGLSLVQDNTLFLEKRERDFTDFDAAVARMADDQIRSRLDEVSAGFHRGPLVERLLWAIYHRVVTTERSSVLLPHGWCGRMLWGGGRLPDNWLRDLRRAVEAVRSVHATSTGAEELGLNTALILSADEAGDACNDSCPWHGRPPHSHLLVRTAPRFLGGLADFGCDPGPDGYRQFAFLQTASGGDGTIPSLRELGRQGRLRGVFLPALLGETALCARLGALVNSLVREATRRNSRRGRRTDTFKGCVVRSFDGRTRIACPLLQAGGRYVGFNGNGRPRHGLGFLLATRARKLAECVRPWADPGAGDVGRLIELLREARGTLGLIVAAIDPRPEGGRRWLDLEDLAESGPAVRARVHVRVYTDADFVARWARAFGWSEQGPGQDAAKPPPEHERLRKAAAANGLTAAQLAREAGVGPRMVQLVLRGGRKPSPALSRFLRGRLLGRDGRRSLGGTGKGGMFAEGQALPEVALAYHNADLPVVPMSDPTAAKAGKPTRVRWKEYQTKRPEETLVRRWWMKWPAAGIGVVLGPAAGLCVIDVDGEEAHAALTSRVPAGLLDSAPKVFSGSGKPYRYHLWFQCPDLPGDAAAVVTPWHDKLEFRCHKCLAVAPPSPHKSGNLYRWADGRSLEDLIVPPLPAAVLEAVTEEAAVRASRRAAEPLLPPPPLGPLPEALPPLHPLTARFLKGEWAYASDWNRRLFLASCDMCGRQVPKAVAEPLLLAGARPVTGDDLSAARQTIESAYGQPRYPSE